ncbi:Peroxin-3 [Popillia japonica]|uniref:Peroxisomal biogenesis factor 3 n=1 Tax=Popillia japonica TaxID=7064 RepID=A0AAW1JYG6_POPJA
MSVFSKLRDFLYRHRNKFLISGIIITGTILLNKYAQQRLREWQEREAKEILERTRKEQHYESIERTCNETILNISIALKEAVAKYVNTEDIVAELRTNPENKVDLWNDLKVLVFTRAGCLIYLQVMLVIILRIQLTIVGGYLFKDSSSISTELQKKYLSLCNTLLEAGATRLQIIVKREFTKLLTPIKLGKQLKLKDLDSIFWAFQTALATSTDNPVEHFKDYVVSNDMENGNELFRNMINDTVDLLESEEVKTLTNHCLNRSFVLLSDNIAEYYIPSEKIKEIKDDGDFIHPTNVEIPMAKLIPIINGLISKDKLPDQLIQHLILNAKVKTLGANIYECFSHVK